MNEKMPTYSDHAKELMDAAAAAVKFCVKPLGAHLDNQRRLGKVVTDFATSDYEHADKLLNISSER